MPIVSYEISASSDDAVESGSTGGMDLTGAAWRPGSLADGAPDLYGGLRFQLAVGQGDTINAAKLKLVFPNSSQDNVGFDIHAELIGDSPTFTSATSNISSRTRTVAFVNWTASNVAPSSFAVVDSVDFAAVVQEVVDLPAFALDNWISIIVVGTSERPNIATYDRSPVGTLGAILEVNFTASAPSGLSIPVAMNHLRNQRIS